MLRLRLLPALLRGSDSTERSFVCSERVSILGKCRVCSPVRAHTVVCRC
ncbi:MULTISPECIES: hypothetical protein [Candidatus Ichthyocystis]|nr:MULTISPECIES: hypothetical protein [Ichthyocystis]